MNFFGLDIRSLELHHGIHGIFFRFDNIYFYRTQLSEFSGIFLDSKLEAVYCIAEIIVKNCKAQQPDFELSVGISPYYDDETGEQWIHRSRDGNKRKQRNF